jgi:hypothetical protein
MKMMIKHILLALTLLVSAFTAIGNAAQTEDKFAVQLKANLISRVSFVKIKDAIQIKAKPNDFLPLEFIKGEGLRDSDGILSEGDSFAWPGCGFDRTSYRVNKIAPEFVEIRYSRGTPEQDGYHDSGVLKINYEKKNAEQGAAPNSHSPGA